MISTEKNRTIGKYIIVILCMAILFFLLLPFLEEGAGTNTAAPKKASPQIFTSNPLTDLVRKFYSLFARNGNRQSSRDFLASSEHTPGFSAVPMDTIEPSPDFPAEMEPTTEKTQTVSAATDAYGDAAFVDENGEWVLIQQTAPDSSQRGLHEVNARDSAYDKLLRLERQAKYTGSATTTAPVQQIPESKWARMWNPIKKLFMSDRGEQPVVAAAVGTLPPGQGANSAVATSSANAASGSDRASRFGKFGNFDAWNAQSGNAGAESPLLSPQEMLHRTADQLKETAKDMLDGQNYQRFTKLIDQKEANIKQNMDAKMEQQLLADAGNTKPYPEIVSTTLIPAPEEGFLATSTCGDVGKMAPSAFFATSCNPFSDSPAAYARTEESQQQVEAAYQQSKAKLSSGAQSLADRPVLVTIGVSEPSRNPFLPDGLNWDENTPLDQKVYELRQDFMFTHQGCDKNPCVIVANKLYTGNDLEDTARGAGVKNAPFSPELTLSNEEFAKVILDSKDLTEEEKTQALLTPIPSAAYVVISVDRFNQLPENTLFYADSAADMLAVHKATGAPLDKSFWGTSPHLEQHTGTPADKGLSISDDMSKQQNFRDELGREGSSELTQFGSVELVKPAVKQAKEQISQNSFL